MGLKQLNLKRAYSSDYDDILHDFYIPALSESIYYDRLAGFFSSTSLAITARGIMRLINNGGTMRLIVSPKLTKNDLDVIIHSRQNPAEYLGKKFLKEVSVIKDEFIRDHIYALGWLIANNKLEIKIALTYSSGGKLMSHGEVNETGIFHQKVGIFTDAEGSIVTFSGSINETASGWLSNIEEFKVFSNWNDAEIDYVNTDINKFDRFWNNNSENVDVIDIPKAVERKLIEISPEDIRQIDLKRFYKKNNHRMIKLYQHQEEAVNEWLENGMMGIFEMATGTGKTFAALGCVKKAIKTNSKIMICVTCPKNHLVQQWRREINKFGVDYDELIIADSSNPGWKNSLADAMIDVSLGYKKSIIAITTHSTFSSENLTEIISNNKSSLKILILADEVHGLGAEKRKFGLISEYDLRLGLSATPKRWFDEIGTNVIYNYFGDVVYEFGLEEAINTINPSTGKTYLTPYRYKLKFASLNYDELQEYADKTKTIAQKWGSEKNEIEKVNSLELLLFMRARIIKNASSKFEELDKILDELATPIKWTIIYCSPEQINRIMRLLQRRGIIAHRFTMEEGTKPQRKFNGLSERDYLLYQFSQGNYQVLVAMRCLDEGVDIPPARTGIFMSSSGNPREYIQRLGRVLRRYPGKREATIYDIVIIPQNGVLPAKLIKAEQTILKKEMKRYEEISRNSINNAEALGLIYGEIYK
jgi:superfamily II DNA or RNA helicase